MDHWDARDYERNSRGQQLWGQQAIARLGLSPHESLLDVGCGDGKITAEIARIVSRGSAVGLDSSPDMVALARERFPRFEYGNLEFVVGDAMALAFHERFDVVFSNSSLHWVSDHPATIHGMFRSLRPGGRVYLSFGARGTAQGIRAVLEHVIELDPWRAYFVGFQFPLTLHGPDEYRQWLTASGFEIGRVDVVPRQLDHAGREGLAGWVRTTWFPYLNRVPDSMRQAFLDAVLDEYLRRHPIDAAGRAGVAMVSLEVEARRPC